MYRIYSVFVIFIMFSLSACEKPPSRITILHHNDFHAANMPYEYNYAKDRVPKTEPLGSTTDVDNNDTPPPSSKSVIQGAAGLEGLADAVRDTSAPALWLFAGDEFTGTPISSLTKGASQIQIVRRMGIDLAVLGNHEFDYGLARAEAFRDSLGIPVLGGANLQYADGRSFAQAFLDTIVGGVSMRIIGVVPPDLQALTSENATGSLIVSDPVESIRKVLPADNRLAVVLSHCGYYTDARIARMIPELDVIIGGHQHAVLQEPVIMSAQGEITDRARFGDGTRRLRGTVITQAGSKGAYLGVLSLAVRNGDVVAVSGQLLPNDGNLSRPNPELEEYVTLLENQYTQSLDDVIATLPEPLTRASWGEQSPLSRWVTDCFRQAVNADIAFQNPGGLRKDLKAGDLKVRDIWESNPFGNTLVLYELTGKELHMLMLHNVTSPREPLLYSGLTVNINWEKKTYDNLRVNGGEVLAEQRYKVVTNSYMMGHFEAYFGMQSGDRWIYDSGLVDRDVLIEAAREAGTVVVNRMIN